MDFKKAFKQNTDTSNILSSSEKGLIFDIQRFVHHDGSSIRTFVSFKGCPLQCKWCNNPESQEMVPKIMFHPKKCFNCKKCINICSVKGILSNQLSSKKEYCNGCGNCADVCVTQARQKIGYWIERDQLLEILKKDITYYQQSNGGVTIGGGEPTIQNKFLISILKGCKDFGINTAIETCGYVAWDKFKPILDYTDLLLFDIKHIDPKKHQEYTQVSNEIILKNAINASAYVKEIVIRIPLIPQFNDSIEDINSIGQFIHNKLPQVTKVSILPYHSMGESKDLKLGKEYNLCGLSGLTRKDIYRAKNILQSYALKVSVVG